MSARVDGPRDYWAPTLGEAAAAMLRDPEVWRHDGLPAADGPGEATSTGIAQGPTVEQWVWDEPRGVARRGLLRVWLR